MNFSTFYKSHLLGKILAPKINEDIRIKKKCLCDLTQNTSILQPTSTGSFLLMLLNLLCFM